MRLLIPLFSPPTGGTWGGLTRTLAITQAAVQAGHEVAFCAAGELKHTLEVHGYRVYPLPEATMLGLPRFISRRIEQRSQRASLPIKPGRSFGSIWLVLMATGYGSTRFLREMVAAEIHAVEDFRADILFTELDPAAFLTALITGRPMASTYATIATRGTGSLPWRRIQQTTASILRAHHLSMLTPDELCFGPHVLKIIPSIPELDGADPSRPDIQYVGALLSHLKPPAPGEFQPEPDQRYVFTYVGTGSVSLNTLEAVLPQVFPSDGAVKCIVGAQSIPAVRQLGGIELWPYVPAEPLLTRCDWTICHGGQNTIMQSLRAGVPLIIFPGPIFERRDNAEQVARAGAGIMGELPDFSPHWLREAMQQRDAYAAGATRLRDRILSHGGAPQAVDALAAWASQAQ